MVIEETARPKINLNLHVLGRRADGLHLIDSHVAFLDCGDRLAFAEADRLSLKVTGPFADALQGAPDNLVIQAAHALADGVSDLDVSFAVTLEKNLPVAAGLGSGSADAAATLRGILRARKRELSAVALTQLAAGLGADVPVCLLSRAARLTGTGIVVEPAAAPPESAVLLVNPGIRLETQRVYQALGLAPDSQVGQSGNAPPFRPFGTVEDLAAWMAACRNDLEPAAARLCPEISRVVDALMAQRGCLLARMSGSGATCFGLFSDRRAALDAEIAIGSDIPEWWTQSGILS